MGETPDEIEARVDERGDLIDRLADGDSSAIEELIEHATKAKVKSVKVTRPRSGERRAAG